MNTPSQDRPGKAKRRILVAAARLFHQQGFARTTVRDLAEAVGIQSGSLFHHFASKEDILFGVMDEIVTEMDRDLAKALAAATTPRARLRALIHTQLGFVHGGTRDAVAVLVHEWQILSPERQAALLDRRQRYFDRWHEVLNETRQAGLTGVEPTVLRQLLHGAMVWSGRWYNPDGPQSLADLEEAVLAMALAPAAE